MRVAVVWNHHHTVVINRSGRHPQEEYRRETIENVVAALQEGGHQTLPCKGDKDLATLERIMPLCPASPPPRNGLQHGGLWSSKLHLASWT
ncbi:hypothetical protein QO004_006169 [Rhizobium mesoamericanum]|nr:hypothetical protein [Rhizobium mesoamericanum]